jgi:hypothetical protein
MRAWVVDMTPGAQWPHVDEHDIPEPIYVVSGELVEGGVVHRAGSYLFYAAGSSHRPRTREGVRLFGINAGVALPHQPGRDLPSSVCVDDVVPVQVGPECLRRDLPSRPGVRAWVVDMAPGAQWPHVDEHDVPEQIYVVSGDLIEAGIVYRAGSYLSYAAGSSHRPRTKEGVRLFGFNAGHGQSAA